MKKLLFVSLFAVLTTASSFAQTTYELAFLGGVEAGIHSMNQAVPYYYSGSYTPKYYVSDVSAPTSMWNSTDYFTYSSYSGTKYTYYQPVTDPESVQIAAYSSIVSSYNYYLMSVAADNGGDLEKGSFDGYKAGLNSVMLGL